MVTKKKAIICDIDGCLLNVDKIYIEINAQGLVGIEKWNFFHKNANKPFYARKNVQLFQLLNQYEKDGYAIILLTARSVALREQTYKYLTDSEGINLLGNPILVMRQLDEEDIQSHIIKARRLAEFKNDYDIQFAIDDELENCIMFRNNNIFTLRVMG